MGSPTEVEARSTAWVWLGELLSPQRSAYAETSTWLNGHVPAEAKVLVAPDFGAYPVMYHSPQLRVMWQLRPDQQTGAYSNLPGYIFQGQETPDLLVAFGGREAGWMARLADQFAQNGTSFPEVIRLDVRAPDRTRPEIFWRDFSTVPPRPDDGVFIFVRAGMTASR